MNYVNLMSSFNQRVMCLPTLIHIDCWSVERSRKYTEYFLRCTQFRNQFELVTYSILYRQLFPYTMATQSAIAPEIKRNNKQINKQKIKRVETTSRHFNICTQIILGKTIFFSASLWFIVEQAGARWCVTTHSSLLLPVGPQFTLVVAIADITFCCGAGEQTNGRRWVTMLHKWNMTFGRVVGGEGLWPFTYTVRKCQHADTLVSIAANMTVEAS